MAGAFLEVTHVGDWFPSWTRFCWEAKPTFLSDKFSFLLLMFIG